MDDLEKREFLKERGWNAWYNEDYLVNIKFKSDAYDYTNRGLSLNDAYEYETNRNRKMQIDFYMQLKDNALKLLSNIGQKG